MRLSGVVVGFGTLLAPRVPLRYALPGWYRERQRKEKLVHALTTPKASRKCPLAAVFYHDSAHVGRSRYGPASLHRNDYDDSSSSLLDRPAARLSPPKSRYFAAVGSDTRLRAQSLLRKKRKWGAGPAAEPHVPAPSTDGAHI